MAVDPETAKHIPTFLLPKDLKKIFPEGIVEGTVGALLADYLLAVRSTGGALGANWRG